MEKVLVIGGTGPTGPLIVEGLVARGAEVTILHRGAHELPEPARLEHIHADPHDREALSAALAGRSFGTVFALYGRLKLIAELVRGRAERLISIGGTNYPLGDHAWLDETAAWRPGVTAEKMQRAEDYVFDQWRRGHYAVTHLRYANIYGPRQLAPREWSLVRRLRDGRRRFILCDSGIALETRLFSHNGAAAALHAYDRPEPATGETFNVADDHPLTDRERLGIIARAVGVDDFEVVSVPANVARPAWFWSIGRSLKPEGEPPEVGHRLLSTEKITRVLGFRPPTTPEDGLSRTARWYCENPPAPGGAVEAQLGDPFDYESEDRFLREWDALVARLASVPVAPVRWQYGYGLVGAKLKSQS